MSIKIVALKRDLSEKIDKNKAIPAVLYGNKVENIHLLLNKVEFDKVYAKAGESNLLDLEVGDLKSKVIIKDVAYHPVKHTPIHVDLYQVNMKEKISASIPLIFLGEPKAVKELGGLLMKYTDEVEVKCLPGDLIDHIDVDVSGLNTFEDSIHMEDLNLPASMELMREKDEIVVNVIAPKAEVEIKEEVKGEVKEENKKAEEKTEKK